ncbi:MAG: nucleotidyltransferase domain-containing protein [Alphaproteobacteria bacterium]|nr:nucleotidyltransferase domain-containing protein [Alphaproteobacteria bacterium]
MRLSLSEIEVITTVFKKHFWVNDHLWIFGSRVDNSKRGVAIDLYIETAYNPEQAAGSNILFISDLWIALGEQHIDIVLKLIHSDFDLPIYHVAKKEGIQLALA